MNRCFFLLLALIVGTCWADDEISFYDGPNNALESDASNAVKTPTPSPKVPVSDGSKVLLPRFQMKNDDGQVFFMEPSGHVAWEEPDPAFKSLVIVDLNSWKAFYGIDDPPTPPVDFSKQSLLILSYQHCFNWVTFNSIEPSEKGLRVFVHVVHPRVHCNVVRANGDRIAVAIPKTAQPLLWKVDTAQK